MSITSRMTKFGKVRQGEALAMTKGKELTRDDMGDCPPLLSESQTGEVPRPSKTHLQHRGQKIHPWLGEWGRRWTGRGLREPAGFQTVPYPKLRNGFREHPLM